MFGMITRWCLGIGMGGAIALGANCASAQITTDGTLPNNSIITPDGSTINITGGTQSGVNLFHSFREFSVTTGSTAYFNNAVGIQNIISRVTGRSVSNIDGLISANGRANLFLINPNGIIFGQNASLNVGGSFLASTASAVKFADSFEFSATASQTTPLLTVSIPIGLQYGSNPGSILYQSQDLELQPGNTLVLVGGDVSFDSGIMFAPNKLVELGGLATEGTLGLSLDGNRLQLNFPNGVAQSDVSLINTLVYGNDININAKTLLIEKDSVIWADGNIGNISIQASGSVFLKDSTIQAGRNLLVQASDSVSITRDNYSAFHLKDKTYIIQKTNNITAENVHIQAHSVSLNNGSGITARRIDARERGLLTVKANQINLDQGWLDGDDIVLQVKDLILMRNFSYIDIYNYKDKGGNIRIDAPHGFFVASNNSDIDANVFYGNGGKITITATGIFGLNVPNRKDVISPEPLLRGDLSVNAGKPYNTYISSSMLPTNDVTAFSEQNPFASGIKTINILGISPRLVQLLPTNLVDTSQLLDTSCNPRSKQQASSFIITGRGGLPRNPYNFLSPNAVLVDWVTLNPSTRNRKSPAVTIKPTVKPKPIVEATGWVINAKGELELTANAPTTPHGSWQNPVSCRTAS